MYIINSENLTNVRIFSEKIGEWLIEHKIPVLSKNEKGYVFANTRLLKSDNMIGFISSTQKALKSTVNFNPSTTPFILLKASLGTLTKYAPHTYAQYNSLV